MRKRSACFFIITIILLMGCGNSNATRVKPIVEEISEAPEVPGNLEVPEASDIAEALDVPETEESTEELPVENAVSIVMVGDMLLHDRIEEVSKNEDGSYEYDAIFAHTRSLIEEADIAIANEEVIIGGSELGVSGYPAFNAPYEFADTLADVGFDVICHGTNHALDKGGHGIINCLNNWEERYPGIAILGIHDSAEDQAEVYVCEKNGIKIAILNYTYGTNGINLPVDMPFGVDYMNEEKIKQDLKYAEENADFTIVCPHWGTEYSLEPDAYQAKWADIFAEGGADLIIGTHPHVIEKIDWTGHGKNDEAALCYYSLGNFVNWTSGTGDGVSNRMVGAMARVKLSREEDGKVSIDYYDALPLISHVTSNEDGVTVYPLYEYTEELACKNEIVFQAADFSLAYCRNLVEAVLGDAVK